MVLERLRPVSSERMNPPGVVQRDRFAASVSDGSLQSERLRVELQGLFELAGVLISERDVVEAGRFRCSITKRPRDRESAKKTVERLLIVSDAFEQLASPHERVGFGVKITERLDDRKRAIEAGERLFPVVELDVRPSQRCQSDRLVSGVLES